MRTSETIDCSDFDELLTAIAEDAEARLAFQARPVVVIDDATGRAFGLTMSGGGDNYQLHSLLADRLIGDPARGLLVGDRPAPAWIAAATTGPPGSPGGDPIMRRFRLFDATGAYIYPEGRPADIVRVEGARVIVLHPPRGNFGWACGRTYEHMIPALTLDHVMTPDQAAAWRAHRSRQRDRPVRNGQPDLTAA